MNARAAIPRLPWLLLLWPAIGWTLYTTLMVYADPFFWLARRGVEQGWTDGFQDFANLSVLALVIVGSGVVAYVAAVRVAGLRRRRDRIVAFLLGASAIGTLIFFWLSPVIHAGALRQDVTAAGPFVFGPYPHPRDLEFLAGHGFTIVSLMDSGFTLIEEWLIDDEEAEVERLGASYVHIPLTPWVEVSDDSRAALEALATSGGGPFYMHCFLGRHRAQEARVIVADALGIDLSLGDRVEATDAAVAAVTHLKANGFQSPLEQLVRAALLLGPALATAGVLLLAYARRRRARHYRDAASADKSSA